MNSSAHHMRPINCDQAIYTRSTAAIAAPAAKRADDAWTDAPELTAAVISTETSLVGDFFLPSMVRQVLSGPMQFLGSNRQHQGTIHRRFHVVRIPSFRGYPTTSS